jgi:alpha-N-arabinofuranosidase
VYNEEAEELTIFAINRHLSEGLELEADVRSFEGYRVIEHIVLEHNDLKAVNKAGEENVSPHTGGNATVNDGILSAKLARTSWNVIRLAKNR